MKFPKGGGYYLLVYELEFLEEREIGVSVGKRLNEYAYHLIGNKIYVVRKGKFGVIIQS